MFRTHACEDQSGIYSSSNLSVRNPLAWVPLIVAAFASYGSVGYNYGFALYFLNYNHGFVKRGLVGGLFSQVAFFTRSELLFLEYAFLVAAYALCYFVFRRALFRDASSSTVAVLLLSAPGTLSHIGYLFAQPDVTLFLLLLLSVWCFLHLQPAVAAVVSLPLCSVALLAHEAFSLMFYPLVVAILLQLCRSKKLPWTMGLAHVAVVFGCFVYIVHFGTLKVSPDTILAEANARTNIGIQRQVYDVMASTFAQQQELVRRMYTSYIWRMIALTFAMTAPYLWLLSSLLRRAMRAAAMPAWQKVVTPLLFLLPLVLCVMGHDFTRWLGAGCVDASLFILYLLLTNGGVKEALGEWASPKQLAWLGYLVAVGPMGATGIRSAEQILAAWNGR